LSKVTPVNHNTKLFTFDLPDPEGVLGLQVNSCILTQYKGPFDEKPVVRPYTPVGDVDEKVIYPQFKLINIGAFRVVGEKIS
jgi:cytochrome-b5 reductase